MYNLANSLKETRFYQEVFEEGRQVGRQEIRNKFKRDLVKPLAHEGINPQNIAQILNLSLDEVQEILQVSNEAEI